MSSEILLRRQGFDKQFFCHTATQSDATTGAGDYHTAAAVVQYLHFGSHAKTQAHQPPV